MFLKVGVKHVKKYKNYYLKTSFKFKFLKIVFILFWKQKQKNKKKQKTKKQKNKKKTSYQSGLNALKSHKDNKTKLSRSVSVKKAKDKWWNKQGNTSFLDSSKSMVEMDLESDKGIFCFVLFWFNLCFERMFNNLWWYTCSQIKLYKNVLNLLYLHDVNFIV